MFLLALFGIFKATSFASVLLLALGVVALVAIYYKMDDRKEQRRLRALRASAECREIGDTTLAKILEAYAVGDYTGVTKEAKNVIEQLIDKDGIGAVAMRASLVAKILPALLEHPTHRHEILKVLKQNQSLLKSKPKADEESAEPAVAQQPVVVQPTVVQPVAQQPVAQAVRTAQ